MDMVGHLRRLFDYDAWANREVLAALKSAAPAPSRSVKFMAHILSAEHLWLQRLQQQTQSLPVWPEFTLAECESHAAELALLWRNYLGHMTATGLEKPTSYVNSKGERWASPRQDILLHVVMHSAYHRGQIATDMRAAGLTPAYTDFIHCVRQGLVE
jgi:uncharacterized damage-inducible protein DinB